MFTTVSNQLLAEKQDSKQRDEWKFVALIYDQIALFVYSVVFLVGMLVFYTRVVRQDYPEDKIGSILEECGLK